MKSKFILTSIFVMLMVMSMVPLIKAVPTHEQIISNLDFWSGVQYNIDHGLFLFTSDGDKRHCGLWDGEHGQPNCADTFTITNPPGSKTFQVSNMCSNCVGNFCGENGDKKCNGGLVDWYKVGGNPYYYYLWERKMPTDFPVTVYTAGDYAYEVYCCECPVGGCSDSEECTNGERKNYVCRGNDIWSNYCDHGDWIDKKYKTCSSPQYCSTPQVYDGVCTSNPINPTCGNGNCESGETATSCPADCGTVQQGGKSTSLTQDAWDDATAELVAKAMCKLPGDCSNIEIYNMGEGLTAENYTTTCITSTTIRDTNKQAIVQYLSLNSQSAPWYQSFIDLFTKQQITDPNQYSQLCASNSLPALLGKLSQWFTGTETCKNTLASVPTGTCRATVKTSAISYCEFTSWASLKLIDKNDKCKDGLYTILIGFVFLMFILPLMKPK